MDIKHAKEIRESFQHGNDPEKQAKAATLWENLLKQYPMNPFLLLKVADLRWVLGSEIVALPLYEKVSLITATYVLAGTLCNIISSFKV